MSGEHLLIIARAASKRLDEANVALSEAEREHRIAWANYDAVVCAACEGSGETGHTHSDGTQYSDRDPPCVACGGTGRKS